MKCLKNFRLFSMLFVFALLVASCAKEDIDNTETTNGQVDPPKTETQANQLLNRSNSQATSDGFEMDCITINYDFSLVDQDGVDYLITSDQDLNQLLGDSSVWIVDFVYPLSITHEDGTVVDVNNAEELGDAFAACLPNTWNEDFFPAYLIDEETSCYTMVYPMDLADVDGNIITVADEDEFVAAIASEPVSFVFPFDLLDENGDVVTLNSIDDLLNALFACGGYVVDTTQWESGFEYIGCYLLDFPFSVMLADGSVVEVLDHMQYCDLLLMGQIVDFAYPLSLLDENGEVVVANSAAELQDLIDDCYDGGNPSFNEDVYFLLIGAVGILDSASNEPCYDINFPIELQEIDLQGNLGQVITVNDIDEFTLALETVDTYYNLIYPIEVTPAGTTVSVEINSVADILDLLSNCGF